MRGEEEVAGSWPELPLGAWAASYATVHLWSQMLGKTRLSLSPPVNHCWHTALYVTARGLTTSAMPCGADTVDVELDFIDQQMVLRRSDGRAERVTLRASPIAELYAEYLRALATLQVEVEIWPQPVEIAGAIRFDSDDAPREYDPEAVRRCWRVLAETQRVLQHFRSGFTGKCSPVNFWWGAFDLALTRFSGRKAPVHPGGVPNLVDHVAREAYSHECMSAGWWPGTAGGPVAEPAFYAYVYPEPAGFADARVGPAEAYYHPLLREWILPYEAVRHAADPDAALLEFYQGVYEAGAELGGWDRGAVER